MDPEETFKILDDDEAPYDERVQAAGDLLEWLGNDGALPGGTLNRGRVVSFCHGFIAAAKSVRAMPEFAQLRQDLRDLKNTQHVVDSSRRLVEALDAD